MLYQYVVHETTNDGVITTEQCHSTKPEPKFSSGSHPVHSMSEICDGENL